MTTALKLDPDSLGTAQFNGLRLSIDQFETLPDDGYKYELMDGVVVMSPRATPPHQASAGEIFTQLDIYLKKNPVGKAFMEVDVRLRRGKGRDLVYAPDVVFVLTHRLPQMRKRIEGAPELVVEVISQGSRKMDTITKRKDYERFAVREYWIVDPDRSSITFLRLQKGRFVKVSFTGNRFGSKAVPGFVLDVAAVRDTFKAW